MKFYTTLLFSLLFLMGISSCYDEPDFPMEPRLLGFDGENGIRFVDVPNTIADSLIIRVSFQDGDGNLGLSSNEISPVLREQYIYITDNSGDFIVYDPQVHGEFNCADWKTPPTYIAQDTIRDTIRADINPYYYNFEVDLFVKESGVFEEYDLLIERCRARLGGRFPRFKEDFSNTKPLEGIIEYGFASPGLVNLFRNDTLKIAVRIIDRALNVSNTIESRAFVLSGEGDIFVED